MNRIFPCVFASWFIFLAVDFHLEARKLEWGHNRYLLELAAQLECAVALIVATSTSKPKGAK